MPYIKNFSMIIVALFCLHGSIEAMWPFEAQAVSTLKSNVQCLASPLVQKTVQYIKQHPSKVAAITIVGIAAVTVLYLLRFDGISPIDPIDGLNTIYPIDGLNTIDPIDGLSIIDPKAYCDWAEKQLNYLDAQHDSLRSATKFFWIKKRIREGYELTGAMRPRFFDIRPRLDDQPYETLSDVYKATLASAPFFKGSEGVFKVLGLRWDASFKEATSALEIWGNDVETHKEAVDYDQRHAALRQLTYIIGTPFGWANYCAYARGRKAVEQLPRGVVQDRVEELAERVMRTRANYDELLHAK